jgi:thiamine-monophosphate kinase
VTRPVPSEESFLRLIRRHFGALVPPSPRGIGDDAAVWRPAPGRLLAAADVLIESVHFRRDEPPYLLGRKALAVNLSDVAAMGGRPHSFLLTLALPADLPTAYTDALLAGMASCAREHRVLLAGGDTCASPGPLMISIAVMGGLPGKAPALTRSGARAGDALYISGPLGVSATGRALLEAGWRPRPSAGGRAIAAAMPPAAGSTRTQRTRALDALRRHLDPVPRLDLGLRLRAARLVSAAMDLSDGLSLDLWRMTQASGTGARLLAPAIPIGDAPRALGSVLGRDPLDLALHGGEDYELLVTVPPGRERKVEAMGLVFVGRMTARGEGLVLADGLGRLTPLIPHGFDHFHRGAEIGDAARTPRRRGASRSAAKG